ncbi:MAG: hypothetical protein R6V55_11560, partial [Desulfovermiculus sp.]
MSKILILFLLLCVFSPGSLVHAGITPSQVLVLYNADWQGDHPLTGKGQDSRELAEHYVRMNTDPATGEKPFILGLSSTKGNLLNHEHLQEKSKDNRSGVILTTLERMIGSTSRLRDSRLVEFTLPKQESGWQFNTLNMQLGPLKSKLSERLSLVESGKNLFPERIVLQQSGDFTVRLNGRSFLKGSLLISASCRDGDGEIHRWQAEYKDIGDIAISRTGPDKVRDDKNYLKLIENPVKAFLEDPDNALPDGTLLKDHILFFVIAYGLPRTCIAPFGIERGITHSGNNFGAIIDLGQRLQLMYYDLDAVMGTTPRPYRFESKDAFTTFYLRSPQSWPLFGPKANPFMHPEAYQKDRKFDSLKDPLPLSSADRKSFPQKHLYFAMRIDAANPMQAKSLIDRAAYAKKFAAPDMGVVPGADVAQGDNTTGKLKYNAAGPALWEMGYKRIYYHYTSSHRLEMFRLPPEAGFYNSDPVY